MTNIQTILESLIVARKKLMKQNEKHEFGLKDAIVRAKIDIKSCIRSKLTARTLTKSVDEFESLAECGIAEVVTSALDNIIERVEALSRAGFADTEHLAKNVTVLLNNHIEMHNGIAVCKVPASRLEGLLGIHSADSLRDIANDIDMLRGQLQKVEISQARKMKLQLDKLRTEVDTKVNSLSATKILKRAIADLQEFAKLGVFNVRWGELQSASIGACVAFESVESEVPSDKAKNLHAAVAALVKEQCEAADADPIVVVPVAILMEAVR